MVKKEEIHRMIFSAIFVPTKKQTVKMNKESNASIFHQSNKELNVVVEDL